MIHEHRKLMEKTWLSKTFSSDFVKWTLLLLGATTTLMPYVWMLLSSFKSYSELLRLPFRFFPDHWSFANYEEILNRMNFTRYYLNTVFVSLITVAGQIAFNSLAAYAFACMDFPGKKIVFSLLISLLMIPPQMTLVANYTFLSSINWTNNYVVLIIPGFISVYGIFFMRQFFIGTPKELLESACIDGSGHFRIYWKIVLPLSRNALVAYGIFALLGQWNELLWPLTMTSSDKVRVLSLAIAALQGQNTTAFHLIMAASVISTLPMLLVFIVGQRSLIEGIAITGIKA